MPVGLRMTLLGLCLLPAGAAAPAAAQFRGAWVPPAGELRLGAIGAYSANDAWFCGKFKSHCRPGERGVLSDLTSAESTRTRSLYVQAEISPVSGLSVSGEIPLLRVQYQRFIESRPQPADDLRAGGLGDLRFGLRAGTTQGAWALSGGYGIIVPTGDFDVSAFVLPVGQGTLDHELFVEAGRTFHPLSVYIEGGVLYRLRSAFVTEDGVSLDWGNEGYAHLAGGYALTAAWSVKADFRVMKSGRFRSNIPGEPPGEFRSLADGTWTVSHRGGSWTAGAWARTPFAGRNTPADPEFGLALSWAR